MSSARENSAPAFKKPAKSEGPYDLNAISNGEVIKFFRKDKALRKRWQKIMDTDRHNSKFQRHVHCLTTRDTTIFSKMKQETNSTFLREPKTYSKEFETDVWTTLCEIATQILNVHPKIGRETYEKKKHYAENVLIPEGCEQFLMHKFNMSETQAKECYLEHHIIKCDHCDLFFNKDSDSDLLVKKDSDIDKHVRKVHKASIDLENRICEILDVAYTVSAKEFQKRIKKHYTKFELSSRKEEVNKLYAKVENEIKKKKEALAKQRRLEEAQNHEEDQDFLDMDF